ncbi:acetyl-CoA carboxylase biotin carboxyl carrier protein subunit [Robiginitalea aurantiaca]|uniref:Acetyl-CoA carboxylase biotin carboxyl carrier protein subunit n=1 Tax=Robiginitalea aurantiaca TaxID=3056915 RepID=A0ABT7WGN4_9FLAO|nr:acetyl-CoA carboxylase biotin carboxyl carrier protein subunit [Robiginitalea aurantiaca]MDM9632076.1 acetyl-CoA carboxylase biotin carboxyl carrier protein subunit [Robiginitalea aurantiaca]
MANPFEIKVNGEWSFHMDSESLETYDQARLSSNTFHVIHNSHSFEVQILEEDFDSKSYKVSVNGKPYTISISNPLDQLISTMGFELGTSKNVSHIEAPMPGLILDIQVSQGDEVREGDPLLVLEAMKMENVILSPRDGKIAKVAVEKGAAVDKKSLLLEFE